MRERLTDAWEEFVRFLRSHLVEIYVFVAVVAFVIFLFPSRIIVTIPSGNVGVMWRRFQGGTDLCTVVPEGTHFILPWDRLVTFDARLLQRTFSITTLANNGLRVGLTITYRYQLIQRNIPALYEYAGSNYAQILLDPEIDVVTRNVVSQMLPAEIYANRTGIQQAVKRIAGWLLYIQNDPTNLPMTLQTPEPNSLSLLDVPAQPTIPPMLARAAASNPTADASPGTSLGAPRYTPVGATLLEQRQAHKGYYLPCPGRSSVANFLWVNLESILVSAVRLPPELEESITKTNQEQQEYVSYYWKQRITAAEAAVQRTQAAGVRDASIIMSKGLTNEYLRYEEIQAVRDLSLSTNAKTVLIGGESGLTLQVGSDSAGESLPVANSGTILSPQQYLMQRLTGSD